MIELLALVASSVAAFAFATLYFRQRAEREEDEQAALSFTTLADVAPAGIWRTDARGQCIYVNRAWEESAGLTDWEGDRWARALHPDDYDDVMSALMTAVAREERIDTEWRWLRPDGSTVWVKGIGAPEYDEDGEVVGYVGINFDIQRSKDLEAELMTAREKALDEAQAKSTFLANMSHEIRTPMNGVVGFTELLMESDLDETQRDQVRLIAESGRAMMQLLNDVLDHSKIESGQLRIVAEPTDVRHKLNHAVKLMEPMARARGLSMSVWIEDDVPELVELDPLRLRQILLNLIGNAVKFTENGGIDVEARVETSNDGKYLLISVIDTGIGIEEAKLEAIFSPFRQEDGTTARRYGGTGLGLSISSQLVTMMDGRITVHSKQGVGTQFTIRLPLRKAESLPSIPAVEIVSTEDAAVSSLSNTHVLIAEDHGINQELIMSMAEALGIDAELVENGEQAVEAVIAARDAGRPFAAVLMDMQMPDVDGLEATRQLRAMGFTAESLPIIALTANCYPDDVAACREAGMQSHLGKPVTTVALARELARWLGDGDDDDAQDEIVSERADLAPMTGGLVDRYRDRKVQLLAQLKQSLERSPGQTDWAELASQLHKLAGVAANFGEPELGEASRRLENWLKMTPGPEERMLALRREWPHFEKAA
ncbi:PAS domain-containing hybrid sensor histidine kinase/response regulator [Aurantiacibacter aquimixticola]|nr:PAS domain-containing hybrid sensor histidine kinase/response regulator [Aurantiacibacter aquimixticola]